jgi:hypothetical protein
LYAGRDTSSHLGLGNSWGVVRSVRVHSLYSTGGTGGDRMYASSIMDRTL